MHSTPSKQCSPQCWSPSVFPAGLLDLQGGGTCGMLFSQTCLFSAVFASISSYESSSSLAGYICSRVICFASSWRMHTVYLFRYVYVYIYIYIYDAGLPHPPSPPLPMVSALACQVGSCLVCACCFPRLVLFGLVPSPPCGVGPVVFLLGPAPPVGGSVFYRGMVWLLPLVISNVIVTCLVPSPPVGWGLWSFWLAPPSLCGAVCSTEIWYGCCRLLAVMSS